MKIGEIVRVKGTKMIGEIVEINYKRVGSSTNKMFCVVKFETKQQEFGVEELTKNLDN